MSVDVKTPTRTQFEHSEFPCGDKRSQPGEPLTSDLRNIVTAVASSDVGASFGESFSQHRPFQRKRRLSERGGHFHQSGSRKKPRFNKQGERMVLPSKFLLGGNITDPLNLNALCDDEIGRVLNETTPQSSPLPVPDYKQEVQVLIPPNINDPLNLNAAEDDDIGLISPKYVNKKKKQRHKKKRPSAGTGDKSEPECSVNEHPSTSHPCPDSTSEDTKPSHTDATNSKDDKISNQNDTDIRDKDAKVLNEIVSPVILEPRSLPKSKKLNRLSGECSETEISTKTAVKDTETPNVRKHTPQKPKAKRQFSHPGTCEKTTGKKDRYLYGNYNRYYGYRNPQAEEDHRISCFREEWFKGKDVLDIGCNIGHITLTIAREFLPKRILGMDIDNRLISTAKKNIRHYMTRDVVDASKFPVSLPLTYGPIAAPAVASASKELIGFPHNVMFMQGNYVLDKDEELDLVQEEYDVILALSLTKWIHLNFGDSGLKRMFKRIHRQLRPGGKLVLEPQSWASYKKKKKITDTIFKNFQQIRFRPEQFTEYLLSREVGFMACEHIDIPYNRSEGFQRPIQVYMKAESGTTPGDGVTPLMDIDCTPSTDPHNMYPNTPRKDTPIGMTPKFEFSSTGITPGSSCQNTPTYLYGTWSANVTPKNDSDNN